MRRLIILILLILLPISANADWQATLESNFDIVDTFDGVVDWQGKSNEVDGAGGYFFDVVLDEMPTNIDESTPIWNLYTNDTEAKADWIKDHGTSYRWVTGSASDATYHKSACINYLYKPETSDYVDYDGYGPSRLGTFFGTGSDPKTGYPKIHVFFMLKFPPGFFPLADGKTDEFQYESVMKFLDITSGFTENNKFGTDAEILTLDPARPESNYTEYGWQGSLTNIMGGGASYAKYIAFYDNSFRATWADPYWTTLPWEHQGYLTSGVSYAAAPTTYLNLAASYLANEWMGVEVIIDRGTVGSANGSLEVYLYNQSGTIIGYNGSQINTTKMNHFDHYYNKVTFGGNRLSNDTEMSRTVNHFYIDDVIIDPDRIGIAYFALLNGGSTSGQSVKAGPGSSVKMSAGSSVKAN